MVERVDEDSWMFWCPGCQRPHPYDSRWTMTGTLACPTFRPSLVLNRDWPEGRCHLFITEGRIEFQSDCFHELKGQTVRMKPVDAFTGEARP